MKIKNAVYMELFGRVTTNGSFMRPFIFPNELTLNTETYVKCPKKVVWITTEKVATGKA